ncbi:MAG TPA: hypothetical protein VNN72_06975 [Polyangiaceae bacterium]|nr:hypothetical protein [Polyangiaceae bacterium]
MARIKGTALGIAAAIGLLVLMVGRTVLPLGVTVGLIAIQFVSTYVVIVARGPRGS